MANASLGAAAVADPPQGPSAQDLRVALDIFLQGKDLEKVTQKQARMELARYFGFAEP